MKIYFLGINRDSRDYDVGLPAGNEIVRHWGGSTLLPRNVFFRNVWFWLGEDQRKLDCC